MNYIEKGERTHTLREYTHERTHMERRLLERTTPKGNYTEKRLDGKGNPRREEIGHTQRGGHIRRLDI